MVRIANRMQEAVNVLTGKFQANASEPVSYTQGATTLTGLPATRGRTPFETIEGGVVMPFESDDFIIPVAMMQSLIPASGDTITDANGVIYVVSMPKGLNLNVYEGFRGTAYKIHTKAVG